MEDHAIVSVITILLKLPSSTCGLLVTYYAGDQASRKRILDNKSSQKKKKKKTCFVIFTTYTKLSLS